MYVPLALCSGAYCPGGGRGWPLPGFWSFDENTEPIECPLAEACPGAVTLVNGLPAAEAESAPQAASATLPDGSRQTQVCDATLGYTGAVCSQCLDGRSNCVFVCCDRCSDSITIGCSCFQGFTSAASAAAPAGSKAAIAYARLDQLPRPRSSHSSFVLPEPDQFEFAIKMTAALVYFIFIGLAVAFFDETWLSRLVRAIDPSLLHRCRLMLNLCGLVVLVALRRLAVCTRCSSSW